MKSHRKTARTIESIKCLRCGRKNALGGDAYDSLEDYIEVNGSGCTCWYCCGPLINVCADNACGTVNLPQARFCKRCGGETVFKKNGVFDEKFCKKIRKLVKERYGSARGRKQTTRGIPGFMDDLTLGVPLASSSDSRAGANRSSYFYKEKYPDWLQKRVIHPSMFDSDNSGDYSGDSHGWSESTWASLMQYHEHQGDG